MFRQKTTIVVGAGASCEIGLPSGDQLKNQIADLFAPTDENSYGLKNQAIIDTVKGLLGQRNTVYANGFPPDHQGQIVAIRDAARRIHRGLPLALSIDNFLHTHQSDAEVVRLGKTAIAMSILEAERRSALHANITPATEHKLRSQGRSRRTTLTSEKMVASWYVPFVQLLMSGLGKAEAGTTFRHLRFVIFNYDRCLEQYLWMALQAYFDLSDLEAAGILASVDFLHPYGSLGPLPWQASDGEHGIPIGGGDGLNVWNLGSRIRTFTESVESAAGGRIKAAVEDAATILLLGFGYLEQNVELLTPGEKRNASRIISSAYGVSIPDQEVVRAMMATFGRQNGTQVMLDPGTCRALFDSYRLQIVR